MTVCILYRRYLSNRKSAHDNTTFTIVQEYQYMDREWYSKIFETGDEMDVGAYIHPLTIFISKEHFKGNVPQNLTGVFLSILIDRSSLKDIKIGYHKHCIHGPSFNYIKP